MNDVDMHAGDSREQEAPAEPRAPRFPALQDPLVRVMALAALGLVVLFLATVAGAMITGVAEPDGPRSAAERELRVAAAVVEAPGAAGEDWAPYVNALIASGDLAKADAALDAARASVAGTSAPLPELDLAEARLLSARRKYEEAVDAATTAMEGYVIARDARNAAAAESTSTPTYMDVDKGYYEAALVKAYASLELHAWDEATAMFDVYIDKFPTAADILVDRGNAKASAGDNAGAEADYREALKYVPYDEEAKAGLKRIGVEQ